MDRAAVSYLYELSAAAGGSGLLTSNGQSGQSPPPACLSVNSGLPMTGGEPHLIGGGSDNYCLRWNEFEKKYAESFRHLRDNEYFTDVTLTTEGHSVKAHRVILSACSTYFHAILKSMGPWQHPVIMLQDVKPQDLNALIDFIYFGQVHMSQDSLPTFLKIAERLKIKGLCETLSPNSMPPTPTQMSQQQQQQQQHQQQQQQLQPMQQQQQQAQSSMMVRGGMVEKTGLGQGMSLPSMTNFENLLPRSPYIPPDVNTSCGIVSQQGRVVASSAPPAHQSPKQVRSASNTRQESFVYVSQAKRTKYANSGPLSPQSILRNQLQLAKELGGHSSNDVEIKSEPMAILSSQEDVPSSGVNVQELMSSHEGDLASLSAAMPQGISPHFMFSPDPEGSGSGGQTLVAVEDRSGGTVRMVEASLASSGVVTSSGIVTSVNVSSHAGILVPTSHHLHAHLPQHHHHQHQQQQQQQQQQHLHQQQQQQHLIHHHQMASNEDDEDQQQHFDQTEMHKEEPQDLTPAQQHQHHQHQQHDSPSTSVGTPSSAGMLTPTNHGGGHINSPSTPTPPKNNGSTPVGGSSGGGGSGSDKKSAARKSCPYCQKDFHEMSLKRHIKDVHFRSQNTYVICPQCNKQYASQNSLYSHLNRVHNVKKDVMLDIQLPMGGSSTGANASGSSSAGSGGQQNDHDGIVNLAHHSDSSNG